MPDKFENVVMSMKVKWYPPFDQYFGGVSDILLSKPISLREMLSKLQEEEPAMKPYARFGIEDKQPHGLMAWRKGEVLSLDDMLQPEDEIEIIIMVAGG